MKILFAEDNAAFRLVMKNQLEFVGHQVIMAANGQQGLDLARETRPDLILSDIQMPEMDGYKFCQAVRADEFIGCIPFIFYTGTFIEAEDAALALALGADRYLLKPLELQALLRELSEVVARKRAPTVPPPAAVPPALAPHTLYHKTLSRKLDKKMAETALYREIIRQSREAIAVIDRDGHFLLQNQAHQQLFALTDPLTDWTPALSLGPDNFLAIHAALRQQGRYEGELTGFTAGAIKARLEVNAFSIVDSSGEAASYVLIIRDMTRRQQAEAERNALLAQLAQAQKMEVVGRLAGGIAHDFNNILNSILGYSELALLDLPTGDPLRGTLEIIQSSGEKAARLVRQLLAFSRKQILEVGAGNLNQIVTDLSKMLPSLIGGEVRLALQLAAGPAMVMVDAGQIEQVLINMAVNARDAMPTGGTLTISTDRVDIGAQCPSLDLKPGPYITLTMTDTGIGMDQRTMARVFEPFFTTKDLGKGAGLGMSTAFGIVKQHLGQILVASQPGQGTTFTIYLPEAGPGAEAIPLGLAKQTALATGQETLLVVEDDPSFRRLLLEILAPLGYRLLVARDGREAQGLIDETGPAIDLLLADVILPGLNGRQVAEHLRARSPASKVLFMSGYTDEIIAPYGIRGRDINFIQKPFSPLALTVKIRQVLDSGAPQRYSFFTTPQSVDGTV